MRPVEATGQFAAMPSREAVLVADAVSKTFGGRSVVSDVSFAIPRGVIVGFIGPSGCGKTTLVRLMTGTYAPTSGAIWLNGRTPSRLSRRARQDIGYLPQSPALFEELSVWQNLNFHASLYGMRLRRRRRLMQMLELVELTDDRRKLVGAASGGMQRRAALAAALVHDPHLLFLDEPTAGIDPLLRRKFWDHFRALRDNGRTLVVTTQYVGEAAYCDLVAVLARGRLLTIDTPESLRKMAFGSDLIEVATSEEVSTYSLQELRRLPEVQARVQRVDPLVWHIGVDDAAAALPKIVEWFDANDIGVTSCHEYVADYDDVFIRIIERCGDESDSQS